MVEQSALGLPQARQNSENVSILFLLDEWQNIARASYESHPRRVQTNTWLSNKHLAQALSRTNRSNTYIDHACTNIGTLPHEKPLQYHRL